MIKGAEIAVLLSRCLGGKPLLLFRMNRAILFYLIAMFGIHTTGWCANPELSSDNHHTVRVGNTELVIPWPEGYMDIAVAEPGLPSTPGTLDTPGQRLLARYISVELLTASEDAIEVGAASDFFALQVIRRVESMDVSPSQFFQIKAGIVQTLGTRQDLGFNADIPRLEKYFSQQAKTPVRVRLIGERKVRVDEQDAHLVQFTATYTVGYTLNRTIISAPVVTSTAFGLAKGKVLTLRRIRVSGSPSTAETASKELTAWARRILSRN